MKKINLFIALWMLIASYSRAQCFGNEGCTDGTTTDVTQPCPATNDFHKNTFDWTFPNIRSIDKSAFTAFAPFNPGQYLGNPFYTSGSQEYMRYIAYGTGSDFQPADGWELVKQDFGYYYDATANKWDGTTIASQSGVSGPHYGVDNGSLAYFLLYNKYTGTLRVFADFPFSGQTYENIEVTLSFMQGSTTDPSSSNWANYKPSALFISYDTSMQALDQPTSAISVSAFAKFVTDLDHFCYADFQLSYDPCICFFEQGLHVSFAGIQTADLKLYGRFEGVTTNDPNILLINNGAGTIYGESSLDNFLSSVLNTDGSYNENDLLAIEKTVDKTSHDIANQYYDAQAISNAETAISTFFSVVSLGAGIASGIYGTSSGSSGATTNATIAGTVKDAAGTIANVVNTLSSGLTDKTQTSVMFGGVALSGTSYQRTDLNGVEFSVAIPGSQNAGTRPEYAGAAAGGALPNAPIFNEIPGLFALKTTPIVNRFVGNASSVSNGNITYSYEGGSGVFLTALNRPIEYQFDESSLQVLYSPYINAANTQIYAALEIEGIPLSSTIIAMSSAGQATNIGPNFILDGVTNMTDLTGVVKSVSTTNHTYMTDFVPVSCLGQVIGQEMVDFEGFALLAHDYYSNLSNQRITLVLQVYYEFKTNSYGVTKRTFQILKFPVNINDVSSALSTQPSFAAEQGIPTDLALSALPTTIPANNIIYSKGTITISGNLTLPSGHAPITIRAQNEIDVLPGVEIGPGITLEIQSFLPICDDFSSAAVTPATVDNTFCNSSNYQANQYIASKRNLLDTTQRLFTSNFDLRLYPNPSTDICHMVFTMSSSATASADLIDMTGRVVRPIISGSYAQGPSRIDFSTADIAPGAYMVRYIDGNGNTANKSLVVSHGEK